MARKKPSTSISAAIDAAVAATKPLPEWPAHLRKPKGVEPFWSAIMLSRARDEWTENDLVIAAQLARAQLDIETTTEALEVEGHTIVNFRGTPVMNPRQSVLEQLARRQLALMRSLQMSGASTGKDPGTLKRKRDLERGARKVADELEEDELLA